MNKVDTLDWAEYHSGKRFRVLDYRGKNLRIWLFGLFFTIGVGRHYDAG